MAETEEKKTKPFLMFLSLQEFFGDILKRNNEGEMNFKLGDCYMLVVSRDIITQIGMASRDFCSTNEFQSRYENVEFLATLLPQAQTMEFLGTAGVDEFAEEYIKTLQAEAPMGDLISICDCVANRGTPIFILFSTGDKQTSFPEILQDYIKEEFGLKGYMVEDLADRSPDIIYDIGDVEKIREAIKVHIDQYLIQHDIERFFNTLTDDMENAYKTMLSQHTEDELRALAKERNVFVSRRYTKEQIIDKIIDDIKREGK